MGVSGVCLVTMLDGTDHARCAVTWIALVQVNLMLGSGEVSTSF